MAQNAVPPYPSRHLGLDFGHNDNKRTLALNGLV